MLQTIRSSFSLILLLSLIHFSYLTANEEEYDEVVSLGQACQTSWQMHLNGMRKVAYPFDWLITPFESLVSFILHEGEGFLDADKIAVIETKESKVHLYVTDLTYDIVSMHDFLAPDLSNYQEVKLKYERRIERFFTLMESDKKILFIRVHLERTEAEYLDGLLHSLYPHLEYTLLALNNNPADAEDWGLERVKNFYLPQTPGTWRGDNERWAEILRQFSVKLFSDLDFDED